MESELLTVKVPEWFAKLQAGGPLPPEPSEGWSRWWDDHSGYVWLVIIAGAIGLAYHLVGELAAAKLRSDA